MGSNRDDFTSKTIDRMAKRVGYRCSNPNCRKLTCGAAVNPEDYVNIGVAAHIRAAAPGGKRYDKNMTASQRKSILNGIWLCQTCSKLVDSDELRYTAELLHKWKYDAETETAKQLEYQKNGQYSGVDNCRLSISLNQEIEELLTMMERIHQKLDTAKQDEDSFLTQTYEERLDSLMMVYVSLNHQLKRLAYRSMEKFNDSSPSTKSNVAECMKNKALPRKAKHKDANLGVVLTTLTAAGILVWSAVSDAGVLGTLAGMIGSIGMGWGLCELFQKDGKTNSVGIESIESKVDVSAAMGGEGTTSYMETLRSAVAGLASEVEKLHMDRIEYERGLVDLNYMADCGE